MTAGPVWVPKTEKSSKEVGLHWTSGRSYKTFHPLSHPTGCGAGHALRPLRSRGGRCSAAERATAWYRIKGMRRAWDIGYSEL